MFKRCLTTSTLALCLAASPWALADFYIGGKVGSTEWDDGKTGISTDVLAGYQFSEFLAAEIAYTNLGDFNEGIFTTSVVGASYSLVGLLPLDDTFTLKAAAGYFDYTVDTSKGGQTFISADAGDFIYSLGLNMHLVDNIAISLEYRATPLSFSTYRTANPSDIINPNQKENADNLLLGIVVNF